MLKPNRKSMYHRDTYGKPAERAKGQIERMFIANLGQLTPLKAIEYIKTAAESKKCDTWSQLARQSL